VSDASAHGGDVCGLRGRGVYLRLQIQATATVATPWTTAARRRRGAAGLGHKHTVHDSTRAASTLRTP